MSAHVSRRGFLAGLGIGAAATGAAVSQGAPVANAVGLERPKPEEPKPPLQEAVVPFDGVHQAGIQTASQAHLWMIAFSIKEGVDKEKLRRLLSVWTTDARDMAAGKAPRTDLEPEMYQSPANLTITLGLGEGFFKAAGVEDKKPEWLKPLPEYKTDQLDEKWNDGDLCLQVCADDPMMLSHASRYMIRNGAPYVDVKWVQEGFLPAHGSLKPGETPRNRFGQLDGTVNPRTDDEFNDQVWIDEGPAWLRGGSCLVVRRIEMDIDGWDILDRPSREEVTGRTLDTGAPLGGKNEFDPVDPDATDEYGLPLIDKNSHVALAMPPKDDPEQKLHRRVYTYDLPPEPDHRFTSNTGLIFACYQKDPLKQFDPIQKRLDELDRLNQWIFHIGSAVFVMPRGTKEDEYWAQDLLEG
ncbi:MULTISPECIES: Dyp-type peroxidase [unclassified Corynebacterium]|uniref:Dyp-type peroxidase n=1 Tax=unclassified Corynebacterium TaxID=2624378 RepID=UPI0030A8A50E